MTRKSKRPEESDLRRRATALLGPRIVDTNGGTRHDPKMRQEIEIHRVELELQNEELRAARTELEAGLDRYTQLFDFAPIGYATLDEDGTIHEINHVGAALLFENRSRLIGRRFVSVVSPPHRPSFDELFRTVLESDRRETRELELVTLSEERPTVRFTAASLAGAKPTVLVAFEDISTQKRAEQRILRADAALREADRRKDEFLAVLSHELRTPLSTLLMYGQLLRAGGLDAEKIHTAAEAIERSARVQARLIDDLLDVSRIVTGKLTMRVAGVNLIGVGRAALDAVHESAERKRVEIIPDFEPRVSLVLGDAERLQQVVVNLLVNAIKFTPTGGNVRLRVGQRGDRIRIEVEDTGIGIDPGFLPHLFERFSQADRSMTRSSGGLGLGLSIAQSIVQSHHGTLVAKSPGRGRGATFTITLPVGAAAPAGAERARVQQSDFEASKIRGTRLLVVEDDASTRETLTDVLTHAGADVRGADGGDAAMQLLSEFHPDVLVCDIAMPQEDGCALLRRIRARGHDEGGDVRALALTAFASEEDRQRTREAGFETHLVKPVDIDQLLNAVSALLPTTAATSGSAAN
jgi:PAS domain S-box-containing protein